MPSTPFRGACPVRPGWAVLLCLALAACGSSAGSDVGSDVPDIPYVTDDLPATDAPLPGDGSGNRPPVLAKVGDRVVAVGETLTIVLQATDPDGDALACTVHGDLPDGADFDKTACALTWVPLKSGLEVYLTFVVSDGQAIDRETVQVKVVAESANHPPAFVRLSDQSVAPGEPVDLQLEAHDPDGDPLVFSIAGDAPAGAHVDATTGRFTWTPAADADGTVAMITFRVDDKLLADMMDVRFVVGTPSEGGPPAFDAVPAQSATVGKELAFTVHATDPDGDAVTLALAGGLPAEAFDPATGQVRWTPGEDDGGRQVEAAFSASDGTYETFLRVPIEVDAATPPPTCTDDAQEANNTPGQARPLAPGEYDLSICDTALSPADIDFFTIALKRYDTVSVRLTFDSEVGDLDMDLSSDGSTDTILALSNGTSDVEALSWKAMDRGVTVVLAVYGVAATQYASPYHLLVNVAAPSSSCDDDALKGNKDSMTAYTVQQESETIPGLVACPTKGYEDWFAFWLAAGDSFLVSATPTAGAVTVATVDPDGRTTMTDGPSASTVIAAVEPVAKDGIWFAKVSTPDTVAATYTLEYVVERKAL